MKSPIERKGGEEHPNSPEELKQDLVAELRGAVIENKVDHACSLLIKLHRQVGKDFTVSDVDVELDFYRKQAKERGKIGNSSEAFEVFFDYTKFQQIDDMTPFVMKMAALAKDINVIKEIYYEREYALCINRTAKINPIAVAVKAGADDNLIRFLYIITPTELKGPAILDAREAIKESNEPAAKKELLDSLEKGEFPKISAEQAKIDKYIRVKVAICVGETDPNHMKTIIMKHKVFMEEDLRKGNLNPQLVKDCVNLAAEFGHFDTLISFLRQLEEVAGANKKEEKKGVSGLFAANDAIDEIHSVILTAAKAKLSDYAKKLKDHTYNESKDKAIVKGLVDTIDKFRSCRQSIFSADETLVLSGIEPQSSTSLTELIQLVVPKKPKVSY